MCAPRIIPITRPAIGEAEARAAADVIRSGWLAMGPQTAAFERITADFIGAKHAVAVSSGTAALHLALLALGIGPGDEVIVPSLSFIATANAVRHAGATPILVDALPRTFNLDPAKLEAAVTSRTRAVMPVHQLGLPAELDAIVAVAGRHGLAIVEDAACALGASYRGTRIGGHGRTCCFSFHPRKVITTGEGGMITTDDESLAARLRVLRSQGVSISADMRERAGGLVFEEYPEVGFNYRLTDVQAAIGIEQLKRLPALLEERRSLAARYTEKLAALEGVVPPLEPPGALHSFQSYMVLLEGPWCRREVMSAMLAEGIHTRRGVQAIHRAACYRELALSLPASEHAARRGLMLPLYPGLTEEDQDRVVSALARACRAPSRAPGPA